MVELLPNKCVALSSDSYCRRREIKEENSILSSSAKEHP
jgi:hypothetical protein